MYTFGRSTSPRIAPVRRTTPEIVGPGSSSPAVALWSRSGIDVYNLASYPRAGLYLPSSDFRDSIIRQQEAEAELTQREMDALTALEQECSPPSPAGETDVVAEELQAVASGPAPADNADADEPSVLSTNAVDTPSDVAA